MNIPVRDAYRYAVACPTSMGVRITPENRMAVQNSGRFYMQATSAETNVLNVASSLGRPCLALTKFVEGGPISALIQAQRDYFGAHTYQRVDKPRGEVFHTNWTGHGGNTSASTYNA